MPLPARAIALALLVAAAPAGAVASSRPSADERPRASGRRTAKPDGRRPARVKSEVHLTANSVSPYRIKNLIARHGRPTHDDVGPLDLQPIWKQLGMEAGAFGSCDNSCEASVFRHELDGAPGREVLLKLEPPNAFSRYVVFKRGRRGGWTPLGHIDHDFNRYEMSRHRVGQALGRNWLVIRGQEGSGSGYSLYAETWYEGGAEGVRPVLYYPVEGHVAPWPSGVGRRFKARVIDRPHASKALTLSYVVSYELLDYAKDESVKLYRNRHRAHYVWDTGRRIFVFDAARSNISEAEVAAVAELQVEPGEGERIGGSEFFSDGEAWKRGGYEVFLKYNLRRLLRVARGREDGRKEWLRQFLKDCADTPEKKVLEGVLQKQQ